MQDELPRVRLLFKLRRLLLTQSISLRVSPIRPHTHFLRFAVRILRLKIEMMVLSASGIKRRAASEAARSALQVLADGQFCATHAAQYCFFVPFAFRPDPDRMIGERCVAVFARIVDSAALHLDRNHIGWFTVMLATGLRIEIDATHVGRLHEKKEGEDVQPIVSSSS